MDKNICIVCVLALLHILLLRTKRRCPPISLPRLTAKDNAVVAEVRSTSGVAWLQKYYAGNVITIIIFFFNTQKQARE